MITMKDFRSWVFVASRYRCHVLTGQSESRQEDFLVGIPTAGWRVSLRITPQKASGSSRGSGADWSQQASAPHRLSFRPSWFWSWSTFVAFFLPRVHLGAYRSIRGAFSAHFEDIWTSQFLMSRNLLEQLSEVWRKAVKCARATAINKPCVHPYFLQMCRRNIKEQRFCHLCFTRYFVSALINAKKMILLFRSCFCCLFLPSVPLAWLHFESLRPLLNSFYCVPIIKDMQQRPRCCSFLFPHSSSSKNKQEGTVTGNEEGGGNEVGPGWQRKHGASC